MSLAYDASDTAVLAKYTSVLTQAILRLPPRSPELRRGLYEHARAEMETLLRGLEPAIAESQRRTLSEAIDRVEASANDKSSSGPPEEQASIDDGWLAKLLKRASLESEAIERSGALPLSAIDFAPKRVRESEKATKCEPQVAMVARAEPVVCEAPTLAAPQIGKISAILRKLHDEALGVEASALIASDGSMIATALSPGIEETRIGGMAATLKTIGARAAAAMARGAAQEVVVHGEAGYAVLINTGGDALLLTLTNSSIKLGAILSTMYEAVEAIGDGESRGPIFV